jgi:uncharacterized membrane protein YccF (DUF307 family)
MLYVTLCFIALSSFTELASLSFHLMGKDEVLNSEVDKVKQNSSRLRFFGAVLYVVWGITCFIWLLKQNY